MHVTKELIDRLHALRQAHGSWRRAAKHIGTDWCILYDVATRPVTASRDRIAKTYELVGISPPTRKEYWRPCVDPDVGEGVIEFLRINPELDINDLLAFGVRAAVEEQYDD